MPDTRETTSQTATRRQRHRIRELTVQLHGDKAQTEQVLFLQKLGYRSADSLTRSQAADRIAVLEAEVGALEC